MFASLGACVGAVAGVQRALVWHGWPTRAKVRTWMGIDGGDGWRTVMGLAGLEVRRTARAAAVAYGG